MTENNKPDATNPDEPQPVFEPAEAAAVDGAAVVESTAADVTPVQERALASGISADAAAHVAPEPDLTQAPTRPWRRRHVRGALAATGVAVLAIGGTAYATTGGGDQAASSQTSATITLPDDTSTDSGTTDSSTPEWGTDTTPSRPDAGGGRPGSDTSQYSESWGTGGTASDQEEATEASDAESTGIVLIETELGYSGAAAAGTGMVLTSDGLVLTNNHVIESSTEITVTIASTGETYTATVLGTDADDDVALLQLEGASGLSTVALDDDGDPVVGDYITAVGNAEGGGVLMAADGSVTELESTVTTGSEYTIDAESLDGMIEFEADVVSGDSGGALLDDEGEVVGMTTAASTGLATTIAYAVPIEDALAIVDQILAGDESDGVEIGYPAFLGIGLATTTGGFRGGSGATTVSGATVGYVYDGTPAASAGLVAGDVIIGIDDITVTSGDDLAAAIATYEPGDSVTLTWTDTSGATQSTNVTLTEGPAA